MIAAKASMHWTRTRCRQSKLVQSLEMQKGGESLPFLFMPPAQVIGAKLPHPQGRAGNPYPTSLSDGFLTFFTLFACGT